MSSSGLTRGSLDGILDGILNEIAPSALLPRNDGILEDIALHYDYSEIANDTVLEFAKNYFKIGLAMERLANALVDAYPNSLSIKEASGLIDKGSLSEHIFDINSALNGGVNFHTKAQKVLKYEVGKTRVIASYKSFIKYLARDKNHILGFVTPQNKSANFGELDYEFLLLLDGKNTKSDIVKKLIEKCQKQGITLKEEKDGKIISYKTVAEQQAYFNKAVDIFAKGLEDYFMFEEF